MIYSTTIDLPLRGKLIDIRLFGSIWMPAGINCGSINFKGNLPMRWITESTMLYVNVFDFGGSWNHIPSATIGLPLRGKFIYEGRVSRIRAPRIIYTQCVYRGRNLPICSISWQGCRLIHELAFCGSCNMIFNCGHFFCRPPLIAKHINVRRVSRIRFPRPIKLTRI